MSIKVGQKVRHKRNGRDYYVLALRYVSPGVYGAKIALIGGIKRNYIEVMRAWWADTKDLS